MENAMTTETALENQQMEVVKQSNEIKITEKSSYDGAFEFLKNIKSVAKSIENFWSEPKKKANETWKSICAKEKTMLEPLSQAEAIVKGKMKTYADEQARIEREIQARLEVERRLEADKLIEQAKQAEAEGDVIQAEVAMQMAQTMETPQAFTGNAVQPGTRQVTVLKIINESIVPCYVNGICIRPVDMVAVKKLYSLTGQLPNGIVAEKETQITSR